MRTSTRTLTVEPGLEVLPGYRVVALLSHGGRIDTYDVYSTERDCRCIVKMLRADRRDEPKAREAVLLEGLLLRDLTHPHLVRGYQVTSRPAPAMVLETLPGATLAALVEDGPLDACDVAELGLQLVSVLGYLHRQGWLHLDVKPSNIVAGSGRATLIDLSLVGRPGEGRAGAGTLGYLAPEQVAGRDLSSATDVWGLGVTLFESLTGQLPLGGPLPEGFRRRPRLLLQRAIRRLRLVPDLPGCYQGLLGACLEPDPRDRPDLDDVRDVLRAVAGGGAGMSAG